MKLLLLIPFLFLSFSPILATDDAYQEEVQINENTKQVVGRFFELSLEKKTQNPLNKNIPYVLTIKPLISSPKTQIIWNTPTTLEARARHSEFVNLNEGEEYVFKGVITPVRAGTYDFSVSVISWQYDTNYTNTVGDTLTLNRSLVSQPTTSEYTILSIAMVILGLGILGGIVYLTIKLVNQYTKKAKKWLTPPS